MIIKDVLDQKNFWVWEILQDRYTIIQTWHEAKIITYKISETTIELHLPKQTLTYEEFTHELLRIYLRAIEGIYLTEYLILKWNETPLMRWFFNSSDLFETIGKKLEDARIYLFFSKNGMFINRSSNEQSFIDYYFKFLHQFNCKTKWPSPAVCMFLKSFFLINSATLFNNENSNKLEKLKFLNQNLFSISDSFFQSWKQFDVSSAPSNKIYKASADNFISTLFSWSLRNMKLPTFQP